MILIWLLNLEMNIMMKMIDILIIPHGEYEINIAAIYL